MLDMITYFTSGSIIALICIMAYFRDFYQRLICINMLGNIGSILIVALGSYQYNETFLDIAIIYLLLSYIVTMAILKIA